MSLIHLNFQSKYLAGNTDVNIILPDLPRTMEPGEFYGSGRKYKVLWLLHGTFGDYTDWVRKSNVELYACEKELAVVMPSGQNTDYVNWDGFGLGYRMYDYLTEELMPLVYGWLPVSDRREDNFIAGLSMGGRGACMYAFAHPEKFAAAYMMSWCPQDMRIQKTDTTWGARNRNRLDNAGGLEGYLDSPQNTWDLTERLAGRKDLPKLYFTCGKTDPLMYDNFRKFYVHAREAGFEAEFKEIDGYSHEWRFWELCIQDALEKFVPSPEKKGNAF
ncbi:MAG: hypothetical protein HFI38_07420 [Lachnospiraceae bacterium]|nr:hypothetical protein [Lachnospiraceae bacterium]